MPGAALASHMNLRRMQRAFSPLKINGCQAWIDARKAAVGAVGSTQNAGLLGGTWSQSTGSAQPTCTAGAGPTGGPALVWDGGDYLYSSLASSAWSFLHAASATVFFVFCLDADPNKQFQLGPATAQKSAGPNTRGYCLVGDDRTANGFNDRYTTQVKNNTTSIIDINSANNAMPAGVWTIVETVLTSGSGLSVYRNGTLIATQSFTGAQDAGDPQATLMWCGGIAAGGMPGKSTTGLIYDRALTAAERDYLRRGLAIENNISVV